MTTPLPYVRLRQICLVARDMSRAEQILTQVLGLEVAFRDERVAKYGLCNLLLPLGTAFIEVVVPTREGTAAGRFLDRFDERRGYMVICDCGNLAAARQRVERLGLRILHSNRWPRYENLQLHPRDTGGAMVELHHNDGGDDLRGHYEPAGEAWQAYVRDDVSVSLLGAELIAPDPALLARRWAALFDRPASQDDQGRWQVALDVGLLRFLPGADDAFLNAVNITVRDVAAVKSAAQRLQCAVEGDAVLLCGVWFRLRSIAT